MAGVIVRCLALLASLTSAAAGAEWDPLGPGIEYATFDACSKADRDDSKITVVRVDPSRVTLRVLSASDLGMVAPLRAEDWADRYGLALVINAGMFASDWRTHLGYMKLGEGHVQSAKVLDSYKSALVCDPRAAGLAPAALVDLETAPIEALAARYGTVVQNIRMIRAPRRVVWGRSPRRWSEAALGADASGRLLFIFSRSPYSMNELSRCLLSLPLDLVAAQHLEGGGEATLVIRTPGLRVTLVGSYETGANDGVLRPYEDIRKSFPLPNVLGVLPRPPRVPAR